MAIAAEILVVDERDIREIVAEYLARHGFGARTAMDSEKHGARLQEKSADLVILDINMPGEDGLTRLREHGDVCIMMLTAAGEIETANNQDNTRDGLHVCELRTVSSAQDTKLGPISGVDEHKLLTILEAIPARIAFMSPEG